MKNLLNLIAVSLLILLFSWMVWRVSERPDRVEAVSPTVSTTVPQDYTPAVTTAVKTAEEQLKKAENVSKKSFDIIDFFFSSHPSAPGSGRSWTDDDDSDGGFVSFGSSSSHSGGFFSSGDSGGWGSGSSSSYDSGGWSSSSSSSDSGGWGGGSSSSDSGGW